MCYSFQIKEVVDDVHLVELIDLETSESLSDILINNETLEAGPYPIPKSEKNITFKQTEGVQENIVSSNESLVEKTVNEEKSNSGEIKSLSTECETEKKTDVAELATPSSVVITNASVENKSQSEEVMSKGI